jgi:hypothetical protein
MIKRYNITLPRERRLSRDLDEAIAKPTPLA